MGLRPSILCLLPSHFWDYSNPNPRNKLYNKPLLALFRAVLKDQALPFLSPSPCPSNRPGSFRWRCRGNLEFGAPPKTPQGQQKGISRGLKSLRNKAVEEAFEDFFVGLRKHRSLSSIVRVKTETWCMRNQAAHFIGSFGSRVHCLKPTQSVGYV